MSQSGTTSSTEQQRRFEITRQDLPLRCPTPDSPSWCAHPRVYLDIEQTGEVLCPYCGAYYVLKD